MQGKEKKNQPKNVKINPNEKNTLSSISKIILALSICVIINKSQETNLKLSLNIFGIQILNIITSSTEYSADYCNISPRLF